MSRQALAPRVVRPAALSQIARRELCPSSQLTIVNLSIRGYSAAAQLKEEEEDFFAYATPETSSQQQVSGYRQKVASSPAPESDGFFTPELTAEVEAEAPRTAPTSSPDSPAGTIPKENAPLLMPFHALKGRMDHDSLKALTFKPFNLLAMSEVQKRVLSRMPELSGGVTKPSTVEAETPEETAARQEREQRGREDLLVKAKTGTGKTIAFLIPSIEARINTLNNLVNEPGPDGRLPPSAELGQKRRLVTRSHTGTLIITPTRELATQIANEALKLMTWHKEMQVQLLVGGGRRDTQLKDFKSIRKGRKDIIVATPGRLRDLLSEPVVRDALATTDMLVLDEADTLLEMGFRPDLDFILEHLPKERQTFLFSATVSKEIRDISRSFLKPNHSMIDCVPKNESNVHLHVPQYVTTLKSAEEQLPHILRLIAHDQLSNPDSKIILFLPTTKQTMLFATLLREASSTLPDNLSVHEIHSRLRQDQRSRAAERFRRDKRSSVLVTSDVSARGVDYPGVTRVIQVGIPSTIDQYVHRVGRTGRGGSTGGRGDLILLPFEADFTHALKKVPFKTLETEQLKKEIAELNYEQSKKLGAIEDKCEQLLPLLDPEAVSDVFTSLLGYYLSKTDLIGGTKQTILQGLEDWSVNGAGLARPPYLSASFKQRLGLDEKPQRRGFALRDSRSSSFGSPRNGFVQQADRVCHNCNQPGHMSRDCTEPSQGRSNNGGDRERRPTTCYNCQQTGHVVSQTPQHR